MPFRVPTRVTLRPGCFADLSSIVQEQGLHRVLLVTDAGLQATPWPDRAVEALRGVDCTVEFDASIEANPRHTTVDALAERARAQGIEGVIGLGGGSVLDAAKAVALLLRNAGSCLDYEGKNRFAHPAAPFIAVPTTCGTGSEVTWVSVITHTGEQRKLSIKGDGLFPTAALVDADLLATLPPHLIAYTGLDALTHALEAYTGTEANPISDALAEKAVALLFQFLPRLVADPAGDGEAREAVMRAATLAGLAFGNADVAGVHCLSETLGGLYDVPHGLANAMLLAPMLRYHLDAGVAHEPLVHLYMLTFPSTLRTTDLNSDAARFVDAVDRLVADLDLPPFSSFGIPEEAYPEIARRAVTNNSNASNPQPMAAADYERILAGL